MTIALAPFQHATLPRFDVLDQLLKAQAPQLLVTNPQSDSAIISSSIDTATTILRREWHARIDNSATVTGVSDLSLNKLARMLVRPAKQLTGETRRFEDAPSRFATWLSAFFKEQVTTLFSQLGNGNYITGEPSFGINRNVPERHGIAVADVYVYVQYIEI